jgi:hypothetical protein
MDAEDPDTQTVLDIVDEIEESPVVVTHGILGGKLIGGSLTSVKVAGETVNLEEELDPIMSLLNVMNTLGETEMQNYTEREAELIRSLGEAWPLQAAGSHRWRRAVCRYRRMAEGRGVHGRSQARYG